jgi:hypothetical protein
MFFKVAPIVFPLLLASCGPAVGEVRRAVRSPKPADCHLEIVEIQSIDMMPGAKFGGGEFEMIGMVTVGADEGTDSQSEEIRNLVRPRACGMGGDLVSLLSSGTGTTLARTAQQNIAFTVWAKRTQVSAAPKPF